MTPRAASETLGLNKKSVRQMLTLSHYKLKMRLKAKAEEYGVRVIDVCEAYTSKTISWTGEIVDKLGGAKVIKDSQGNVMDRDLNGARGIFLKNATLCGFTPSTSVGANRGNLRISAG